ncbi:alpha/beta hydrolase [Fictibacillus barbaricus]|uniref:Pimeloyl-ACP methyl ester carboxylesterase n=1 Tax=Fictibacillus barbaricus TaxID=182136 RepID=A0ABU1TXA5_9BACL|nr:alpha/beta hydrolase [Fictibacillus barbaricus]MDR7071819.1 pimeloyl-ACP methyl ester carboxylesterase [Fictibacillus barbaricus]
MNSLFAEKEITFNGKKQICGTLTIPVEIAEKNKLPAVLFISGSGPLDRNANGPKGKFQLNVYKELAEYMTALGFITLRFDKRGTGKSDGDFISTGFWDFVDDAEKAFLYLKNCPEVDPDKIIVLGHSEGTIIGTALSERQPINGLMLLSGGVGNLDEFTAHQRKLAYQELRKSKGLKGILMRLLINEEKQEAKSRRLMQKMFDSNKDVYKILFFIKQPVKWMKEHFAYDTRVALKKVTCPVLAILGDKDPLVDRDLLKELPALVKGDCETHIIKNMEHGFRVQTEEMTILKMKKLLKVLPSRPLNQEGLDALSKWLYEYYLAETNTQQSLVDTGK